MNLYTLNEFSIAHEQKKSFEAQSVSGIRGVVTAQIHRVSHPSGWHLDLAIPEFADGSCDVRCVEYSRGTPLPLHRLARGLRMSILPFDVERRFVELSQGRIQQDAPPYHSNLFSATEQELDEGAGRPVRTKVEKLGGQFGTRAEILGDRSRRRKYYCTAFYHDESEIPLAAYILTRVQPLYSQFLRLLLKDASLSSDSVSAHESQSPKRATTSKDFKDKTQRRIPKMPATTPLLHLKDFDASLAAQFKKGGRSRKIADKIHAWLGRQDPATAIRKEGNVTNHGESRIAGCIKYQLGDGHRLITIQKGSAFLLCFVGNHTECDGWLERNRGLDVSAKDGALGVVWKSPSIDEPLSLTPHPSKTALVEQLTADHMDQILEGISASTQRQIMRLEGLVTGQNIESACSAIRDDEQRMLVHDVLNHLAHGDIESAEKRIELYLGAAKELEQLTEADFLRIRDGDQVRTLRVGSQEHEAWLDRFAREAPFLDWLLFMHPEQERVALEDFAGPAQLSGVSGSGKTCIAVRRAIRLALQDSGRQVAIVTLNRTLAGLIRRLVDSAAPSNKIRDRIKVQSFFELCQTLLQKFEPENSRRYDDITWKLNEHIDEIFREYYRQWHNNDAASALLSMHFSLTSREIDSEEYCREEFDWIRTATSPAHRQDYLSIERIGRRLPLLREWREKVLLALEQWEVKMRDIGITDYLGLTTELSKHVAEVVPQFDHMIIDEAQDFGTTELSLLRKLTRPGANDIFLCGDIAQHILPKHRSLTAAGIDVEGRSRRITRNYRNTREILKAAYAVLVENLHDDMLDSDDLEILDPVYASRRSNEPVVLEASNLEEEFAAARSLVEDTIELNSNAQCCIAIAGFTLREVDLFAKRNGLPCLSGDMLPVDAPLVLSDLEQTKGYEFHMMVIINATENALPPRGACDEEAFRFGCRLYVAMTRARDELYLSYHGKPSEWLTRSKQTLSFLGRWNEIVDIRTEFFAGAPEHLLQIADDSSEDLLQLTGRDFIYRPEAAGLSTEALTKLYDLVDGVGLRRQGIRVKWAKLADLLDDFEVHPRARQTFGPKVWLEVRDRLISVSR